MPFDGPHKLLTFGGGLFGATEDWSCGIRFSGSADPTQTMADACRTAITAWWTSNASYMSSSHSLQWVKLAPIGADGKYPVGKDAVDSVPSTQIPGATGTIVYPPQVSWVISLTTALPRGRAHIGRVFLPAPALALSGAGGLLASSVSPPLGTIRTMLLALNGITDMGSATIKSKFGQSATVTGLRAGLVLDTMRSRRRRIPEQPVAVAL